MGEILAKENATAPSGPPSLAELSDQSAPSDETPSIDLLDYGLATASGDLPLELEGENPEPNEEDLAEERLSRYPGDPNA